MLEPPPPFLHPILDAIATHAAMTLPASPHADDILHIATSYSLPFNLLRAQIWVESTDDPYAFRYEHAFFEHYLRGKSTVKGAAYGPLAACSLGLLQILLETALEFGFNDRPEQLFVPRIGLEWGAKYLQHCLQRANGDYQIGLRYYNGQGPQAEAYAARIWMLAGKV